MHRIFICTGAYPCAQEHAPVLIPYHAAEKFGWSQTFFEKQIYIFFATSAAPVAATPPRWQRRPAGHLAGNLATSLAICAPPEPQWGMDVVLLERAHPPPVNYSNLFSIIRLSFV